MATLVEDSLVFPDTVVTCGAEPGCSRVSLLSARAEIALGLRALRQAVSRCGLTERGEARADIIYDECMSIWARLPRATYVCR